MTTTRPITSSVALIQRSRDNVRSMIEEFRTMPSTVVAFEYLDINGRLLALAGLDFINSNGEQVLHFRAKETKQAAEEN